MSLVVDLNRPMPLPQASFASRTAIEKINAGFDEWRILHHADFSNKSPSLGSASQSIMVNSVAPDRRWLVGVSPKSLAETLFDAVGALKILTSQVAMYLPIDVRARIFEQLDSMHEPDDWDLEDKPTQLESYRTFLRLILHVKPSKKPGLGLTTSGHIVAAWTAGQDRLTVECGALDKISWSLTVNAEGECESAASVLKINRFLPSLAPYKPERWFLNG